ncbi:MAG: ATP-dependent DNA ligase [Candidatus Verstraetearchaeota archaeon]|nr:ATP-dependent DNA ligase [Candidatus Verstraetearchaeota archaeon]
MKYSLLVETYEKIEATTKRLEMTGYLVDLFAKSDREVIDKVIYLTQGKLYPDYLGIELGMAEKLIIRSISLAAGVSTHEIDKIFKELGDVGRTAEQALSTMKKQASLFDFFQAAGAREELTVQKVYETLDRIARAAGEGAQETKIRLLSSLLKMATPKEAKYIVRTVAGKLRLGVADMTILDALALAFCGTKEARPILERAYNMCSDLGEVARRLVLEGLEAVKEIKPIPGKPIRPMLAERLASPEEILLKMGGKCAVEYKYDGERVQAHKVGDGEIYLFSRRLENITPQYPDVCQLIKEHVKAREVIIEGEIVAIDPDTGDMLPFQELMHRRRKYGIEEAMEKYPASLFLFDLLYEDGEDYTLKPYLERRKRLGEIVEGADRIQLAEHFVVENPEELERIFEEAIEKGCEGIIAKALTPEAVYQAGARGWLWIKYKRDYRSEMIDTVDLVAVGAFWGRGKRAGKYGALLLAAYDPENDVFKTVCKCGSGFTDEDLEKMPEMFKPYVIPHKHPRVDSQLKPDVWFVPAVVLEVIGAEITLSPTHTCAKDAIRPGAGLAIRFPRFTGRWRFDKKPEDATTEKELIEMYQKQLKKIEAG